MVIDFKPKLKYKEGIYLVEIENWFEDGTPTERKSEIQPEFSHRYPLGDIADDIISYLRVIATEAGFMTRIFQRLAFRLCSAEATSAVKSFIGIISHPGVNDYYTRCTCVHEEISKYTGGDRLHPEVVRLVHAYLHSEWRQKVLKAFDERDTHIKQILAILTRNELRAHHRGLLRGSLDKAIKHPHSLHIEIRPLVFEVQRIYHEQYNLASRSTLEAALIIV